MSRHQPTSVAASSRSTSAAVSTSVPACGMQREAQALGRAPRSATTARWAASRACCAASSGSGRRPARVHHDGPDEHVGAGGGHRCRHALGRREVERRLVQHERHEAADEREPVGVEAGAQCRRLERQVADRTELGGGQPEARHLGEHAVGRQLPAPAGHLADAPGDRGPGQAAHGRRAAHLTRHLPLRSSRIDSPCLERAKKLARSNAPPVCFRPAWLSSALLHGRRRRSCRERECRPGRRRWRTWPARRASRARSCRS